MKSTIAPLGIVPKFRIKSQHPWPNITVKRTLTSGVRLPEIRVNNSPRSLIYAWTLYFCTTAVLAALFVVALFLLSWLSPASDLGVAASLVGPLILVVLLPWVGLTYIFTSKRFPVQWHWLISAIAALAATQGLRLLPSTLRPNITSQIRSVCDRQPGDLVELPNFLSCAGTTWSALVQGAVIDATTAGAVLWLFAWSLSYYKRTRA